MPDPIYVTRPYLPPLTEFLPLLEEIWRTRILTNSGPFHLALEEQLQALFGSGQVALVSNGMLALSIALDAAALKGEVITTPYSFVATSHAVKMLGLEPVFVDIREGDLNIDPERIESAINPKTTAIVAVHVYGNPCDVEAIEHIASRHGLKVIYDAAHAFGVRHKGRSLVSWGDFATLSFHATKAFNTFEGGAIVTRSPEANLVVQRLRNFGIASETDVPMVGGNAKMSEFGAALGLLQLRHFEHVRRERECVDRRYRAFLEPIEGIDCLQIPDGVEPNYSYFPILVRPSFPVSRETLYEILKANGIYTRRYFYPLISTMPMYSALRSASPSNLPIATAIADQILCLPIYPGITVESQTRITEIIRSAYRGETPETP